MTAIGTSWVETLQGGLETGAALMTPFLRSRRLRWGATDEELDGTYPGDELVSEPQWAATHVITIDARAVGIWPWIAQIGQGRGGFYSYQRLENVVGCGIQNTSRILDEHQGINEGDPIRLHVQSPPMTAVRVEEPTALVLYGGPAETVESAVLVTSWAFLLLERSDGTTRLLSRTRYRHAGGLRSGLIGGPWLLEPVSFVMERKMLKTIKVLAEAATA